MHVENKLPAPVSENPDYEGQCAAYSVMISQRKERDSNNPVVACMEKYSSEKETCMASAKDDLPSQEQCHLRFIQQVDQCRYEGWFEKYKEVSDECVEKTFRGGCIRASEQQQQQ